MNPINSGKHLDKIQQPIAFVLGSYLTSGLGVIRSLGRKGIPVILLDSDQRNVEFFSRYCTRLLCPHPNNNEQEYLDFLLKIGKELNEKGVLFPIRDIEVLLILKNRSKLEKYYRIPMSILEISEKLLNKKIFYNTLERLNIPHPKTFFPNNISDIESISDEVAFPCIIKPSLSAHFQLDFHKKLFMAKCREELNQYFEKAISSNHEVMIQEIIPGDAQNMYGFNTYYNRNCKSVGDFMYRRIREWPLAFGNGCYIQTVDIPELKDIINSLMKKIGYHGIIDAEFKRDPRNNVFNLIEVNPRAWMQVSFPAKCGLNLPYIAYMDVTNETIEEPLSTQRDIKWLYMFEDLKSSIISIGNDKLSIGEWIRSLKGRKEYAILTWDDPIPFLIVLAKSSYGLVRYFIKGS